MTQKPLPELWIVRIARGHAKLWLAIALGCVVYVALPGAWWTVTRMLIGWNTGVALYLALALTMMAAPVSEIRKHAAAQDEGAFVIMVLVVIAAMASLGAIFAELGSDDDNKPTLLAHPWPSGPVVHSTPEVMWYSGWPGQTLSS